MDEIRKIVIGVTGAIVALITISSIILFISMVIINMPPKPQLTTTASATEQDAKGKEIANYKEIVTSLQAQRTNVYDFVVIKTLLPLFNLLIVSVLGYVFAKTFLDAYKVYIERKKA